MGILLHTMATPERDPNGAIALAAELGFDGIELICQAGYRCGLAENASEAEARALGVAAADAGVPIRVLSAYEKGIADEAPGQRSMAVDRLRHAIDLAVATGASAVRILAAHEVDGAAWPGALERLSRSLEVLSQHALEHRASFTLLIENHMDTMAVSAARTVEICRAAGRPNVAILFDPANLATLGAEDFATAYQVQRSLIRHVHVKDAVVEDGVRRSRRAGGGQRSLADVDRCARARWLRRARLARIRASLAARPAAGRTRLAQSQALPAGLSRGTA